MRVTCGLVQEQILHHHAFHRGQAGGNVLRIRIGLHDVFALNIESLERAVHGCVKHVGNAQAGFGLQRHVPGCFKLMSRTASMDTWR